MKYKVSDLCEINSCSISKNDKYQYINYLDTSNLTEGIIYELQHLKMDVDKIPSRAKRKVRKNDILISTVRPNQKHYGIIKCPVKNMIVSTGFTVLTPKVDKVNPDYLYRFFTQKRITEHLQAIAETSTSTYPSIRPNVIADLEIDLPPIYEQKAIANILSSLDDKVEVNNAINKKFEEMAQAIYKQWFVDFEFPNEEGKPYKSSGGAMVESELGMIPKGWEVKFLGDLTSLIIDHRGKTPKKLGGNWSDSGFKAISAKNIKNNRIVKPEDIRFLNKEMYEKWMSEPLKAGDILMTSEAPLGELYYLAEKEEYCLSQRLYGLRSNENIMSSALFFMSLNSKQVIENIKNRATGTTVLGIRQSELRKVPLIVAPLEIQMQIAPLIEDLLRKIYLNENESYTLKKIRDILIPKLMSGEIRVSLDKE